MQDKSNAEQQMPRYPVFWVILVFCKYGLDLDTFPLMHIPLDQKPNTLCSYSVSVNQQLMVLSG